VRSAVRLPLRFDPAPLQAEVTALGDEAWTPHFNKGVYDGDWSGVALKSIGGAPLELYPDPAAEGTYEPTEILRRSPALASVVDAFRCEQQSVRLLRLAPGSSIREHRDYGLRWQDGEARLHVPVVSNPDVRFYLEGELVPMLAGEAWYLDLNRPHRVENAGATARIHLVIDCLVNEWLEGVVAPSAAG
jgi:quercetin dioxygenase-like cupin family protein